MARIIGWLSLYLVLAANISWSWAGVIGEVLWPKDSVESIETVKDKIYEEAFLQAVLKEANNILGGNIEKNRLEILGEFLRPRLDKLIYGYREITFEDSGEEINLSLDCEINKDLLRKELRKYGLLFTANKKIDYDLTLKGVSPEEFLTLSRLQTLTGVKVEVGAPLKVTILKATEKWFGEMVFDEEKIKVSADSLEDLWIKLWARYFDLPKVMDERVDSFFLSTSGWVTISGIESFEQSLANWSNCILKKNLLQIELTGPTIKASWRIWTLDKLDLENKLKKILHPQNIVFTLER